MEMSYTDQLRTLETAADLTLAGTICDFTCSITV